MSENSDPHPRKHALLLGIDRYPNFPEENQLTTCVADTELMADVLRQRFGFPADRIRRLLDAEATYDGICSAMEELIGQVGEDDVVVIHYSGHGSQRRSLDEWEADGRDETIVPFDSGRRPHPNRDVADDQIYDWLLELNDRTEHVTLIFDSCHAGTITRGGRIRRVPFDDRPVDEQQRPAENCRQWPRRGLKRGKRARFGDRHVLIAACREDESAKEFPETGHGALTYFLCQELQRLEPGETYRDLFERFAPRVTARFRTQRPQLEGTWDREVFGIRDLVPMRYVGVEERTDGRVVLGAGAAHGLTIGSDWAVHPPGIRDPGGDTECGRVRIAAVGAVTATAEIHREHPRGSVRVGGRAVELAHDFGEADWAVEVHGEVSLPLAMREELGRRLEESLVLRRVSKAGTGKARIHFLTRGESCDEAGLGVVDADVWVAFGPSGELLLEPRRTEATAPAQVIACLERWNRFCHALALENPNLESVLRNKVRLDLMRRASFAPGGWLPATASPDENVTYAVGDPLAIRVTNLHSEPIYVAILDFGLTGAVCQLYPQAGAHEALRANGILDVGTRRGDELTVFLPDGVPFGPSGAPTVQELVKVFASARQADFRYLTQPAPVGRAVRHPLARLLLSTLQGAKRGTSRKIETDDWTTVTRTFAVCRKEP